MFDSEGSSFLGKVNPQDLTALVLLAWLIFKTIPKGFAALKESIDVQRKVLAKQHKEAMRVLRSVEIACRNCHGRKAAKKNAPLVKRSK